MKNRTSHALMGFFFFIFFIIIFSSIGYFISNQLFKISLENMSLSNYIITSFITMFTVLLTILILFSKKGVSKIKYQGVLLNNIIDALEKISQGDFNVFLEVKKYQKHNEDEKDFGDVVASINKMAKELGSMEMLRQDFISNVSHEIGTPLTSIKGFATLLKNDKLKLSERNHYLDIIETETTRLSNLTKKFLELSKLENNDGTLNITSFSLEKQLKEVISMLDPQLKTKNQQIKLRLDEVFIRADQDLMYEVWTNVIGNSIKFTDDKGIINISLKNNKDTIICIISDNGIGISQSDKIHIFERFYKSDKSRSKNKDGNGLGLSLVKKIIELHNGSINMESELGKGTTFIIKLPNSK